MLSIFAKIVKCNAAQNCSSHGICGPDGSCVCDPSFYGDNCISKLRKLNETYLGYFKIKNFF